MRMCGSSCRCARCSSNNVVFQTNCSNGSTSNCQVGPAGPAGPAGPVGPTGPAGPVGPTGPVGISPADVSQMIADIGIPGPTGPTGPAGQDGADGADGADGVDGVDGQDGADGSAACQMMGYYSGTIPVLLASAGIDMPTLEQEVNGIPIIGPTISALLQGATTLIDDLLSALGINISLASGPLEADIAANLGQGSWVATIESGTPTPLGLLGPQALGFTACQSGTICGLNANFGNICTVNLSSTVAYITAHVEVMAPSCAPTDEQVWTDVSPTDPVTGLPGVVLLNQASNKWSSCGDGIYPLGSLGNSYTTPGCRTVPFCDARINCGDLVRVSFRLTPAPGAALDATLALGYASASLCFKPDPIIEADCPCGCPCENGYPMPTCPNAGCCGTTA